MRIPFLLIAALLLPAIALARGPAHGAPTLERIMSNPDWISIPAVAPYWSADGERIYFDTTPHASPVRTRHVVSATGGHVHKVRPGEWSMTGAPNAIFNRQRTREVWVAHDDLFVRNLKTGQVRQLTRGAKVANPKFMADGRRIAWQQDQRWYVRAPARGLTIAVADLELQDAPAAPPQKYAYVNADPLRIFQSLQKDKADAKAERQQQATLAKADPTRATMPFYLGDDISVAHRSLSPSGRWLLLVTQPKGYKKGKPGKMPDYINDDGRVSIHKIHRRVGENPPAPRHLLLLDLKQHEQHPIKLTGLPGIQNDPLKTLRDQAVEWDVDHGVSKENARASVKAPKVRGVQVRAIKWSDAGTRVAIELMANDNKDRWITTLDPDDHELVTVDRLHDEAWVNWTHNAFGWLPKGNKLWFLSEASGWSQLYRVAADGSGKEALTRGQYVVESPVASPDGRYIYFQANPDKPGTWNIYRVPTRGGNRQRVTDMAGLNGTQPGLHGDSRFKLSPDGSKLLFYHSTMLRPPELYVTGTRPKALPARLTHTISKAFKSIDRVKPEIVKIPSSKVDRPLYARLYLPADYDPAKAHAGAVFIHGAGYLQDAHSGWSYYFREMMFNQMLTREGYVVIDMDYRGSAGYGRDWRTAIYRNMGHPEVADLADGVHWMEKKYNVDAEHVGVYGGSYGGFLTLMSMFRKPQLFAAGSAQRPVSDWANYNPGYTSAILNTPNVDPVAYQRSSPIYFAEGLENPLLIQQGMLDDNVYFQDSVYLAQRLIELKKPFDVEFFPMEHHGFVAPAAWFHEYRKIHRLFDRRVKLEDHGS